MERALHLAALCVKSADKQGIPHAGAQCIAPKLAKSAEERPVCHVLLARRVPSGSHKAVVAIIDYFTIPAYAERLSFMAPRHTWLTRCQQTPNSRLAADQQPMLPCRAIIGKRSKHDTSPANNIVQILLFIEPPRLAAQAEGAAAMPYQKVTTGRLSLSAHMLPQIYPRCMSSSYARTSIGVDGNGPTSITLNRALHCEGCSMINILNTAPECTALVSCMPSLACILLCINKIPGALPSYVWQ